MNMMAEPAGKDARAELDSAVAELADMALGVTGQSIPRSKAYLVEARLAPILRREGLDGPAGLAYCLQARQSPVLKAEVAAALLTRETWFFRGRSDLQELAASRLPARLAATPSGRLRVLCAGGGTGQEAYSLAMLIEEGAAPGLRSARIEIVSVDFCKQATERARAGTFSHYEVQRGLSAARLLQHFERTPGGDWLISGELRARVSFRQYNLLDRPGALGTFDVILCRNVLSGMAATARMRTADNLAAHLAPGGLILLGEGETLHGLTSKLEPAHGMTLGWVAAGTANAASAAG
jgi:chemotaxis protein methyltransferase CheR